jgi:hypothetical protein
MFFAKPKRAASVVVAAGAALALIGVALAGPSGQRPRGIEPQSTKVEAAATQAPGAPTAKTESDRNASLGRSVSATGRVVAADGRPVPGAAVFIREWAIQRTTGMRATESEKLRIGAELPDILARTVTDELGQFRFRDVATPAFPHAVWTIGKTYFPWEVVAISPGHGVAWVQLTPQNQRNAITLALPAEGTLGGRVVEPGGKPIAGARIKVFGIDKLGNVDAGGGEEQGRLNLTWSSIPMVATTAADGTFSLRAVPRDMVATLVITDPRHERKIVYAATTKLPQPDVTRRTVRQGQTTTESQPVYNEEFTLKLKPTDHRLVGRVVLEADGKPAAGAQVSVRQRKVAIADADGQFQVENLAAGEIELHIIGRNTDAAPLDVQITLPEEPKVFERAFKLPPGLVLTGLAVDEETGAGIEGVELSYQPRLEAGQLPTIFGFTTKTNNVGRFRLVVPP